MGYRYSGEEITLGTHSSSLHILEGFHVQEVKRRNNRPKLQVVDFPWTSGYKIPNDKNGLTMELDCLGSY